MIRTLDQFSIVDPWTGPVVLGLVLTVVGIILTLWRDHLQRKVKISVKPLLRFQDSGIGDMDVFLTNEGFRTCTVVAVTLLGEHGEAHPINEEMVKLLPGESFQLKVKDFLQWLYSTAVLVDIAPGKPIRVVLPHQRAKLEKLSRSILKEIAKKGRPYQFYSNDGGTWFGDGKCGVAVEPRVLAFAGNDEIGRSRSFDRADKSHEKKCESIIHHLAAQLPEFFEMKQAWDNRSILMWKSSVVKKYR